MVESVRRVNALEPFGWIDPWSLPFTRGRLARAVASMRARPGYEARPLLRSYVEELAEELLLDAERSEKGAVLLRGEVRLEAANGRRRALRTVVLGDVVLQATRRLLLHQQIEIDSRSGGDEAFLGKEWKGGVTGRFTTAYASVRLGPLRLLAGRRRVAWGTGLDGTLLLQGDLPPFDQIGIEGEVVPGLALHAFAAPLDEMALDEEGAIARRYVAAHRLSTRLGNDRVRLALSETVVFGGEGRSFDWAYANPLLVYYGVQWNKRKDDNVLWSADGSIALHRSIDLFGEFLVDDFQYDRKTEPNQIGFLIGVRLKKLPALPRLLADAEYVRVNNWVYGHEQPWNRYTYGSALLGHPIGPDADRIFVRLLYRPARAVDLVAEYARVRQGEGSIDDPREAAVPGGTGFLTGDVTVRHLPAFEIRLHRRSSRRAFVRVERSGKSDWIGRLGLMVRFSGGVGARP